MTPSRLRQLIIKDSGYCRRGPAVTRFCRKYNLVTCSVKAHMYGLKDPSPFAILAYSLLEEKINGR